jgi:ATP-binding cassette subfamily B protein
MALISRGWLVVGPLGLAPVLLAGSASPAGIAVGMGAVISAYLSLRKLVSGLSHLVGALIAWRQVALLFHAAARPQVQGVPAFAAAPHSPGEPGGQQAATLSAHELSFRYRPHGQAVLERCSLDIRAGERLLLEGPSGGGKSSLAALLCGLRQPNSGLILLGGLDRPTLGSQGWRQRVAAAPQFHENHVLTETFAFNLLMGRGWPPAWEDWHRAEDICRELGLGELLARMPAGMLQMVGESGWQLSHGERSRLYIARALLQGAELVVLDESFAALDPQTLRLAIECVLARAPTLLVIAHP